MINQILLICSAIVIYEFIKFVDFKYIINSNLNIYKKIIKLFSDKKISDLRKEKLILDCSKSLLILSTKIFSILLCILVFMYILNLLSNSFLNLISSIIGIIELTLFFTIYHLLRKKINEKL